MGKNYCRSGFRALTVGFSVQGSASFLEFLERAFDAREGEINWNPDLSVGHGEILIGDSRFPRQSRSSGGSMRYPYFTKVKK